MEFLYLIIYLFECLGELVEYDILVKQFVVKAMLVIFFHFQAKT